MMKYPTEAREILLEAVTWERSHSLQVSSE